MQRKAHAILNGLEKSGTVSKQALQWLTLATDPFHDGALEAAGFPDINTVPTLVQQFTQTVSVDSSGMAGPSWDAHVFLAPFSPDLSGGVDVPMVSADFEAREQYTQSPPSVNAPTLLRAGYNVVRTSPGAPWYSSGNNAAPQIAIPSIIEGGCYRVIAAAVEVVNTTPDLYKQGAVTYYRTPSHSKIVTPFYNQQTLGSVYEWPMTMESFALAPFNQAAAQLYPTSRTLAAEEGYYGIATLNKTPEFLSAVGCSPFGVTAPTAANLLATNPKLVCYIPGFFPTSTRAKTGSARVLPFDVHGAIFTGLSLQTTLQVTTRYFVERIPSAADPDLLVLTRTPTPYDPVIQEIYSRVLSQLPVGCTVKENPLGEWFNDVLEAVVDYAPGIGKVFGPMGAAGGALVAGGARTMLRNRKKKAPAQKQQVLEDTESHMRKQRKPRKKTTEADRIPQTRRKAKKNKYRNYS